MLVGEQPGDKEDLAGRPVRRTGRPHLSTRPSPRRALPRDRLYITNAVKHFKNEPRGKFRLHRKPDAGEVEACRWWLTPGIAPGPAQADRRHGRDGGPRNFGKAVTIKAVRAKWQQLAEAEALVTVHPSFLLRLPELADRRHEFDKFVADLALVRDRALRLD